MRGDEKDVLLGATAPSHRSSEDERDLMTHRVETSSHPLKFGIDPATKRPTPPRASGRIVDKMRNATARAGGHLSQQVARRVVLTLPSPRRSAAESPVSKVTKAMPRFSSSRTSTLGKDIMAIAQFSIEGPYSVLLWWVLNAPSGY